MGKQSIGIGILTNPQTLARSLATPARYADPVTKTSVLSNGLSVSTETIPGASTSTVGLWIDAGSRADAQGASGTAHFLEVSRTMGGSGGQTCRDMLGGRLIEHF